LYFGSHFGFKMATIGNQRWISIRHIIIYLETKFRQIGGLLYLVAILYLGYHGNGRYFEFFQPPNSCHTLRWIFLQSFMKFDERYPNKI
jgi:hypothetical protein